MKEIPLTQGQVALVDDEDYERVMQHKWHAQKRDQGLFYAARNCFLSDGRKSIENLHCFILGLVGIDHKDGDGLNNTRENLRRATSQENKRGHRRKAVGTTSRYRGVSRGARDKHWSAYLMVNRKSLRLGTFTSEEDAARAYDAKALELFGEFASPNFKQTS